jgi:hypothetical protein
MQITLTAIEVADALAQDEPAEIMVLLATFASSSEADQLIAAAVGRHNGSAMHRSVTPWLRRLAVALEAVEAGDDAIDAAGRVS